MEKININLFDNLFSFINEIEQVGNNKEKYIKTLLLHSTH